MYNLNCLFECPQPLVGPNYQRKKLHNEVTKRNTNKINQFAFKLHRRAQRCRGISHHRLALNGAVEHWLLLRMERRHTGILERSLNRAI